MNQSFKREVLWCFKNLHKARKEVFAGDTYALELCRNKINEEFKKHKTLNDETVINELLKQSKNIAHELRTTVIQAREVEPGKYRVQIRPDTTKLDNVPFKDSSCSDVK
ncbi:complex III assembly factor LYRM7 [Agrilus planipennis]|uniref:Complex III assembly factor LYRM7 n=1 Tax=Agrilus planipennis TaxID=224129 RepID=A0A1W4WV46_AGRPL|nr:complex III assembly factor LYRM7 [Agrilus planipennis]